MKNPSKKKLSKIVGGAVIPDNDRNIEIPDKKAIAMNTLDMFLNGEIVVSLEDYLGIKDNEQTKARMSIKNPRVYVSKGLKKDASIKAVKQYMEEKGIQSIEEIVKEQEAKKPKYRVDDNGEIVNIEEEQEGIEIE